MPDPRGSDGQTQAGQELPDLPGIEPFRGRGRIGHEAPGMRSQPEPVEVAEPHPPGHRGVEVPPPGQAGPAELHQRGRVAALM